MFFQKVCLHNALVPDQRCMTVICSSSPFISLLIKVLHWVLQSIAMWSQKQKCPQN